MSRVKALCEKGVNHTRSKIIAFLSVAIVQIYVK